MMLASAYQDWIVETGKQPELFVLIAFVLTFGFIRTSAHMIRAGVSWWPGNVSVGDTHVHHLVWGIVLCLLVGYAAIAVAPDSPWREVLAVLFGIGAGLTLDEFALWVNLEDVYWSEKGRASIDAVIVACGLAGIVLIGLRAWIDVADEVEVITRIAVGSAIVLHVGLAFVNALKGKYGSAALGFVIPVVSVVPAARLARPDSIWARFYGAEKRMKASSRYGGGAAIAVSQPSV